MKVCFHKLDCEVLTNMHTCGLLSAASSKPVNKSS